MGNGNLFNAGNFELRKDGCDGACLNFFKEQVELYYFGVLPPRAGTLMVLNRYLTKTPRSKLWH